MDNLVGAPAFEPMKLLLGAVPVRGPADRKHCPKSVVCADIRHIMEFICASVEHRHRHRHRQTDVRRNAHTLFEKETE